MKKLLSVMLCLLILVSFVPTGVFGITAKAMAASRDDGIWLFPISSSKYNSFSDWAACPGGDRCVLCGTYHSGWGDSYHSGQGGHNGIDISAAVNTDVYAAAPGNIVYAAYNGARGNTIIIEHTIGNGYSYYSYYQHLNSFVKTSGYVSAGTTIGKVGKSGGNYGYHLHFGIVRGASGKGVSALSLESQGWLVGSGQEGRILNNPSQSNWNGNYAGAPKGASAVLPPLKAHMGSVTYTFNASQVTVGSVPSFTYTDISAGRYYIKHNATGKYMDVVNFADENGTDINLWNFNGSSAQLYTIAKDNGGYYIKPDCSSTRLVIGAGDYIISGANVCLWVNTNGSTQRWKFQKVSGGYAIHNTDNLNCVMDNNNGSIYLTTFTGGSNQVWTLQNSVSYDANGGSGAPAIQMKNYGEAATISYIKPTRAGYTFLGWSANSAATVPTYESGDSYTANENIVLYAVWGKKAIQFSNVDEGTYYIKNMYTGKYLNIVDGKDQNNADVHTYAYGGYTSQQYTIRKVSDKYELMPNCSTTRVISAIEKTAIHGKRIILWDTTKHDSQLWKFEKIPNGYVIRNAQNPNLCAVVDTSNGYLYVAEYTGSSNQIWTLEKAHNLQQNGWLKDGGKWYFYENGTMVKNAWRKDSKGWVYLGANGAMLTNAWAKDSKGWCYLGTDGYAVTNCWKKDSKGWIWLDANGSMTKSKWVKDGGKWYYLDANGYMVANKWMKDSKGWVYLGGDGAMLTNKWTTDSKGWCYVGKDGYAVTNCWKKDSKGWIWLDANGSMTKSKWVKDGNSWYYCDASGYMVANKSMTISGKRYNFNTSGVCTNP